MGRHLAQDQHGAKLELTIRLLDTGERDGAFLHGRRSASEYSGSVGP